MIIHLDELRQFVKECKYPEHVISKSIFNAKLQGPAPNPERSKNVIPFVTSYYPNIDNKSLMQTVKSKFKNIRNEHLKSIYKDMNFIVSLTKPKTLYWKLTSSRFISDFKIIRKPETYICIDKRCKICQNYLNETNKITISNGQVWEIHRETDCYSANVIYYLKCKMCNKKRNIYWENNRRQYEGFEVRINQHISECKTGVSTWKFPRHVNDCGIENSCLEESFFSQTIMLRLNKSDRLANIEKHFHLKGYDTINITINTTSQISINNIFVVYFHLKFLHKYSL